MYGLNFVIFDLEVCVPMVTYFGLALADRMFIDDGNYVMRREKISLEKVKILLSKGAVSCVDKSDEATMSVIKRRLGIVVAISEEPPRVNLVRKDRIIVVEVRDLPQLTVRREYTDREIVKAKFAFSLYTMLDCNWRHGPRFSS